MSPAQLRCVIVDDDHAFLEQVKRWFLIRCPDIEVLPFSNSVEAADYLRRQRVDLIVTAYLVAPMDGLQLIGIVRAFDAHVPICMTSSVPIEAAALARGATAFVPKAAIWPELGNMVTTLRSARVAA